MQSCSGDELFFEYIKTKKMRYFIYFKFCSYIPLVSLISLMILVLSAYLSLGHLPSFSNPDPKTYYISYNLFLGSIFLLLFSFFLYPLLTISISLKKEIKSVSIYRYISIYIFCLILLIIILRLDTFNLSDWILD